MTRSVIRHVDWTIGPDENAPAPQRRTKCIACGQASPEDRGQLGPDRWALRHAADTGHRTFEEIVTAQLLARPLSEK